MAQRFSRSGSNPTCGGNISQEYEETNEFLADVIRQRDLRVILTGAGSSAFIGDIAAPAIRRHLGRRVDAIATTDIVAGPRDYFEPRTPTLNHSLEVCVTVRNLILNLNLNINIYILLISSNFTIKPIIR